MEKGQLVELIIEDLSAEGQGIGRESVGADGSTNGLVGGSTNGLAGGSTDRNSDNRGLVVFVPETLPGDRIRARITKVKKSYAFGRVEEYLERSPHRNEEFDCPYADEGCGGCPYGKLDYGMQLQVKEQQVRSKLQRLAGIADPVIRPIIGMQAEDNDGMGCYRYRDKAVLPVSTGGIITRKGGIVENLGEPAVGFFRAKSNEVVDCSDCYLQSMAAMAAADALRTFMEEDHITAFDPKWEKGLMRHMIVKTAFGTGEVMVILVINGKGIPNASKLVDMLDEAIYETGYSLESVVLNINKASGKNVEKNKKKDRSEIRRTGEVLGEEYITLAGKPTITEQVGHLQFEISPASFFQVNPVQMKRLYDQVRAYVAAGAEQTAASGQTAAASGTCGAEGAGTEGAGMEDAGEENAQPVILDLYCGVGSIGLYCADLAEMIIGIESVEAAVRDANRNAVINGIVNARYICGKAEDVLPACVGAHTESGRGAPTGKQKIDAEVKEYIRRADIAILDPPRAGCRPELLDAVAEAGTERIVYVSCDPATLARDVQLLGEMGYQMLEATPVDMFPHTGHVETVVLMSRADG